MSLSVSKKNIVIFIATIIFVFLLGVGFANAQNYVPLVPLPGIEKDVGISLENYLGAMFKIGIGLAGVFAVLMIIIGGIEFIGGASSPSARTEAKGRITNAILGLILALGSWLILNTVNPALLQTKLEIEKVTVTGSSPTGFVATLNLAQYCVLSAPSQQTCFENLSSCQLAEQNLQSAGVTIIQNCPTTETNLQTTSGSCGDDGGRCVEGVPGVLWGTNCPGDLDYDYGRPGCTSVGYVCCR